VRTVLDVARRTYVIGHVRRVEELLTLTDWRGDPTGLEKDLTSRLVTEHEPSQAELAARVDARRQAFDNGDWATLRDLALSDVMWLAEDPRLWMALSAILKINGAVDQAELAHDAAEIVAQRGTAS
jgi:hypothetical protein